FCELLPCQMFFIPHNASCFGSLPFSFIPAPQTRLKTRSWPTSALLRNLHKDCYAMKSSTRQPPSRREPTLAARLLFILFMPTLVLLTGCQEDDRAAHSTAWRASELANNRLGTAAGGLLKTLGQEDRAEKPVA